MATLGCVEFCIFLLHKYYTRLNVEQELVFADVHFTLFFTALFNAFQSALLAFFTTRASERQWVRTEQLEVDHYVEIREEFERVEALLYGHEKETTARQYQTEKDDSNNGSETSSSRGIEDAEMAFEFNCTSIAGVCSNMKRFVRYPHLYRKHQKLLVQIRFHELRVHFLQSNKLPLKFKVSDYLKRSELAVMIKLVHISTFAWLMLLGGVTLLYFLMGIVVYVTQDLQKVGVSLTYIFMGTMVFFVVLSLLIYNKMKSIFSTIMRKRLTSESMTGRHLSTGNTQITSQRDLFWGGNPEFIRSIIQFMQFGFAIALSILLVFWKDINVYYALVPAWAILLTVVLCYAAFVAIMAQVIPRYTLCTSLGQLLNKQRLQETLAQWQLEEAQRRQRLNDPEYYEDDSFDYEDYSDLDDDVSKSSSSIVLAPIAAMAKKPIVAAKKVITEGLQHIRHPNERAKTFEDIDFTHRTDQSDHLTASKSTDTNPECSDTAGRSREQRSHERKARRKAQSVGVAMMRSLGESLATAVHEEPKQTPQGSKPRRQKSLSGSSDIQKMRRTSSFETLLLAQLVQTDTKELRKKVDVEAKINPLSREQRLQARRDRKKSMSDGVTMMRHVSEAEFDDKAMNSSSVKMTPVSSPVQPQQRRNRRKCVSAAASIQAMRDMPLSSETSSFTMAGGAPARKPRSRQSSGGVPRLEPLVEGVQADHSESTLSIIPSAETEGNYENGRPSESRARASSPATAASDDIGTKGTMDSASTLGDGHSDADDIPEIHPDVQKLRMVKPPLRPTLSERARHYFLSERYRMISHVFGTILCFFFVGMRVETLLIASCVMPDSNTTWHINRSTAFWMETVWLVCFILAGFYNTFSFRPGHVFSNKERSLFISAIMDIMLSSLCLMLLMLAEGQRCCSDAEKRFLADEPLGVNGAESYGECSIKCCPSFGSRAYGGLGDIEPLTSLVALRVFRFRFAKRIVAYLDHRLAWSNLDIAEMTDSAHHPFHPFYSKRGTPHVEKKKDAETRTAVELWMKVRSERPELVEKYGEFSTEILQAMLGIAEVAPETVGRGVPLLIEPGTSPGKGMETPPEKFIEAPSPASPAARKKLEYTESRRAIDRKYAHLTPEARSIILSGKLGMGVRSKSVTDFAPSLKASKPHSSPVHKRKEDLSKMAAPGLLQSPFASTEAIPPPPRVTFIAEPVQTVTLESKDIVVTFAAPNARLLRSMRRCDRKLLPLLDQWSIVDVVITKFEIVYFDASDIEEAHVLGHSEEDIKNIESVRQAVIATKGGKGLRLKDVALGRKVVGHLELSSADAVYVDRIMPSGNGEQSEEAFAKNSTDVQVEFWKANSSDTVVPRAARWSRVMQDWLRIQSVFGTLLLRFYSDLEDSEKHPERCAIERESDGPIFKDNAFQWCQTIVRLCGINQLKQKLPHFGDDNDDELRDYLVVVDSKAFQDHPRHMRKKSLGNILSNVKDHAHFRTIVHEEAEATNDSAANVSAPPLQITMPSHGRRLSSFGEAAPENRRSMRILRRLSSTGDIPSSTRELNSQNLRASGSQQNSLKPDVAAETCQGPDMV